MLLLLIILLFINNGNCRDEDSIRRIYHGVPDTDNRFPYVVSIEQKTRHTYLRLCSGIVIDENWILTAGHCVRENATLTVTYRNMTHTDTIERVKVFSNIRHPNFQFFKSPTMNWTTFNDIGLLNVEKIDIKPFARLSSNNYKRYLGLSVDFAGYGNTWNKSEAATSEEWKDKKLMLNNSPLLIGLGVVTNCGGNITEKLCLCVHATVTSTRKGDSGGPLIYEGKVIGVHIGKLYDEMAFVPISRHLFWIREEKEKYQPIQLNYDSKLRLSLKVS